MKIGWLARAGLFLYVLIILAPFSFSPAYPSADNSWEFALNWGAAHGLALGRDLVWTTGPLWYLAFPFDIGNNLAHGLTFQWMEWAALAAIFADLFFVCEFATVNLAVFAVFFGLSAPLYATSSGPENRLVAGALVLLCSARLRGGRGRYVVALMLAGLVPLIKLTGGVLLAGAILGFVADGLWRRRPKAWEDAGLAIAVPGAVALAVCRITIPSLAAVVQYVRGSLEIAGGYNAAMSLVGDLAEVGWAALMLMLIGLSLWFSRERRFFLLLLPLPLFLSFKHSFVRQDGHVVNLFCFAGLALGLIALASAMRWQRVAIVFVVYGAVWAAVVPGHLGADAMRMVDGAQEADGVWQALHPAKLREDLRRLEEASFSPETRLEPELRAIVGNATVASMSLIYSDAHIDGLNFRVFPVVQRFAAYTPYLDRWNANWLRDQGPRFLIADWAAIDGRHPMAETPAMWLEAYRWYETRGIGMRHVLLERRSAARFSALQVVRRFDMQGTGSMDVDAAPFWSLACDYREIGSLRKLLLRIAPVTMMVNGQGWRVPMEVLRSPVMGSGLPGGLAELAELFDGAAAPKSRVKTIAFGGPGIGDYAPVCRAEILAP